MTSQHVMTSPPAYPSQLAKFSTNRERLELIRELRKRPYTDGEVWLFIPSPWFRGWERHCEQRPDEINTEYRNLDTSSLGGSSVISKPKRAYQMNQQWIEGSSGSMVVSHTVWSLLSDW